MVKVTVVGDTNAGKTTLVHKMVYGKLPDDPLLSTIGVDFHILPAEHSVHIWDTGNLEKFGAIASQYYRRTNIFLIIYDCSNPVMACASLSKWHAHLKTRHSQYESGIPVYAIRTKSEIIGAVVPGIVQSYCENHGMVHISVSAYTGLNIDNVKQRLLAVPSNTIQLRSSSPQASSSTCPRCT